MAATRAFDHLLVVMFENQYRHYVNRDPFMRKLASAGADLSGFYGCFHPSQTNYLASLAGEVCAVTNDDPPAAPLLQQTLVDLLAQQQLSWKAYMEGYPGESWNSAWRSPDYDTSLQPLNTYPDSPDLARYFRKHNAFASFHTIQSDEKHWQQIVDDGQFWRDVQNNNLAHYNWFTPDIWNDGHYLTNTHVESQPRTAMISQISNWLEYVFLGNLDAGKVQGGVQAGVQRIGLNLDVDLLLQDPAAAWRQCRLPERTLIVVTFDEADFNADSFDTMYEGQNRVYTVLLGDMITPGTKVDTPFNHYSLMRTVQRNFSLGSLHKNDEGANWMRFLWGEGFRWSPVQTEQLALGSSLALAELNNCPVLVTADSDGYLHWSTFSDERWQPLCALGQQSSGALALAVLDNKLCLVYDNQGQLYQTVYSAQSGWTDVLALGIPVAGDIALSAISDSAEAQQKLMCCWRTQNDYIEYAVYDGGGWTEPAGVGQLTDGGLSLAQLGASVYLVYKERNSSRMRMTSYNTGVFNSFQAVAFDNSAAPHNDTSLHRWAPADMVVGHYAGKFNQQHHDGVALGALTMAAIDGEIHLVYRNSGSDKPQVLDSCFGLTGIFTAASVQSNGYGTLRQTSWTRPRAVADMPVDADTIMAMAGSDSSLMLCWRDASGCLGYRVGAYRSRA
jgi:Phosphoesterase family